MEWLVQPVPLVSSEPLGGGFQSPVTRNIMSVMVVHCPGVIGSPVASGLPSSPAVVVWKIGPDSMSKITRYCSSQ